VIRPSFVVCVLGLSSVPGEPAGTRARAAEAGKTSPPLSDRADQPLTELSATEMKDFRQGDALFNLPLRGADGLGPLYSETSCGACHERGARGPGFVVKMAI
jgi:CxxC motif-containing protein (DUF1111 family)